MREIFKTKTLRQKYEVTPLELFFDLVFVFAVLQLSHHLSTHVSWRGAVETLVMLLAVLTVWSYTSWAATMIPADRLRTRWMVLAVMFLGLFMNASVTRAFTTSGWAFVIPLLLIQLGRTVWTIVSSTDAVYREHYFRVLFWFIATTFLWITGAAVEPEVRVWWWGPAAGLELIGTLLAHPIPGRWLRSANVEFDADHMLERCRLFLLIALGETVLSMGEALAETHIALMTVATGTVALAGTVALWALTFGHSYRLVLRHLEKTSDPIHTSRHGVNATIMMVAGLIAIAVANEKAIAHPYEHGSLALSLLLGGGPILFLAAQGWYLLTVTKVWSPLHVIGGIAMLLVGFAALATPAYIALTLVGVSLTTLAIIDRKIIHC